MAGIKMEEKAEREGTLPRSHPQYLRGSCMPTSRPPPCGPAKMVWYLRMVCVMDV